MLKTLFIIIFTLQCQTVVGIPRMFQEWKTSILRHAKFWSGNGEGYLGVSQDDDSSPVAANEIGAEKTSTRTRRLHMGGYALTAIIGMLLGSFLGGVVLTTPRSCQKTIAEAVMTDSPEDLLPKRTSVPILLSMMKCG